jgi:hypothetical protein
MTEKWVEIERYIEKAEERLRSARLLFDKEFFDDCISRAYYSMYYGVKAVLLIKGISTRTHKGLITQFGLEFVTKGYVEELLGRIISFVEEERESADYDVFATFTEKEAKEVLENAELFLTKIKEFLEKVRKGEIEVK